MGIDVYLRWRGMSEADKESQYTGFRTDKGDVGYLREAYHGGPYATQVLIPEGWEDRGDEVEEEEGEDEDEDAEEDGVPVPAATLRERLPATLLTATYRHHVVYGESLDDPAIIEMDEKTPPDADVLEAVMKDRGVVKALAFALAQTQDRTASEISAQFTDEQKRQMEEVIKRRTLPSYLMAFVDFVELAERKEKETGAPCRIVVSA